MDYTLVICTYNPDERLLQRCLQAVQQLDTQNISTEVIIVDNNSERPVAALEAVKAFTSQHPNSRVLFAARQGVQHARIAAIEAANGNHTVYFDYDNEPEPDYLQQLKLLHAQHPEVAAWGPGYVSVDFVDGIAPALEFHARIAFQEKHHHKKSFASLPGWQDCYPFGTGLCTRTPILKEYVALAHQGHFTLAGRTGKQLTSGEDTQMVLLCIRKGFAAGNSPALRLKHMITGNRANTAYLKRLAYGTSFCYATCLLQVYPEQKMVLRLQQLPAAKFSRKSIKKAIAATLRQDPHRQFALATWLGQQAGVWQALGKPLPLPVRTVIRCLKLF
ncbi:glycosyltransferase [Paraflavitalea sp. CAU 1676]|uniref:glycosyltransferase n=1 Tax=Paraflavitalea sp. CAU 1676 TaxID=3032598 RepID=UPI0023D9A86B|nr:glycosyltransferase [Paraflavitalea sp. CAU 1676]MDF2190587.1 glycosyltransferase [Paraflavitalea sp. CAU 1676]